MGEDRADQLLAYTQKCHVVPLETRIALRASELHRQFRLATADAILYARALVIDADLLTCDARFKGLPKVCLISKLQ